MEKYVFNKNYKSKKGEFAPISFKKMYPDFKINDDFLIIEENLIEQLPHDWMDCVTALIAYNYDKRGSCFISLDDDESENFLKFLAKDTITLLVLSGKDPLFGGFIYAVKNDNDKDKDPEIIYGGTSFLRKYCDERNIYYRSTMKNLNNKKILYSATNLKYLKKEDEDCTIPVEL